VISLTITSSNCQWAYNHYKSRRAAKISAAAAAPHNFGWLGGAPSVFPLAAAPNDSGWRRRRRESAAEGSITWRIES